MDDLEEFRAMLNAVRRTNFDNGVVAERDRIIALLESIKPGCECNDCDKPAEEARTYLDHIIALIKGEN